MAVVGKILLGILLAVFCLLGLVLLLLLVALLLPASVELHYAPKDLRVKLRVLFYTRQLLPAPPPKPQKKSARAASPGKIKKAKKTKKKADTKPRSAANAATPPQNEEKPKKQPEAPPIPKAKAETPPMPGTSSQPSAAPAQSKVTLSEAPSEVPLKAPPEADKTAGSEENKGTRDTESQTNDSQKRRGSRNGSTKSDKAENDGFRLTLGKLPTLVGQAGIFMGAVLRSLHFVHIRLIVPVHESMPDKTAIAVGKTNAWLYGIASALEPRLHLKWDEVCIVPDYDDQFADRLLLEMTVRGHLLPILVAALRAYRVLKQEEIF